MGAIGGLFGLGGGASGTGFAGPSGADISIGADVTQAGDAYSRTQSSLGEQAKLIEALKAQNGLQNQSSVFNQLQGIASGKGPNPAQAMLSQRTGENVANQAALMAGQRGAGANVGLLARQAAQQGAGIQQGAVGQGAVMQANQSLNALNQMGNVANTQAANQIGASNAYTSASQAQHGNLLNALGAQNNAKVGMQSNVNSANAGLAQTGMQGQQGMIGGIFGGIGSALGLAEGGDVTPQSSFGQFLTTVKAPSAPAVAPMTAGPSGDGGSKIKEGLSSLGSALRPKGTIDNYNANTAYSGPSAGPWAPTMAGPAPAMGSGGMVDVVLSPGEKVVPPGKVDKAAGGKIEARTVPGQAKVAGDSVQNDTYKTKLPEGSIVVPRTKAKDNKEAAAFVRAVLAKRGRK